MEDELIRYITNSDIDILQLSSIKQRIQYSHRDFDINGYLRYIQKYPNTIIADCSLEDCSICLEIIKKNDKIYKLNCGHIFHVTCLNQWNKNTCPYCRNAIIVTQR